MACPVNFGDFGHVTTFWIFTRIKTEPISNIELKQFSDKLAVGSYTSKVILCENQQKQQKEAIN